MDLPKNFAKVTLSTGYNNSATSVVLSTGDGAKLPTAPFDAVWWNSTDYPDPSDDPNVEIIRCSARSTDTLTIARAKQGTSASNKNTGGKTYKMAVGMTAQVATDIRTVYPNGAPFWNVKHKNIFSANVSFSTGENDLYTVPAGRKAIVVSVNIWNISGTSPNVISKIKNGSNYFRASATTASTSGTAVTLRSIIPLDAGESFSLNFSTGIAANVAISIIEFDANSPVAFAKILGTLINGDNTLYTCPAGYTATPLTLLDISKAGSTGVGTVNFGNESGGSLTLITNLVPSGGTAGSTNKMSSGSASNNAVTSANMPCSLEAGDFLSVNTGSNSASQCVWGIFFESPLPE